MKKINLWTVLLAFAMGQAIQLVTVALSRYLYISDPVMVCIAVAIMTTALVVLTAIFTLMDREPEYPINGVHARPAQENVNTTAIKAIFGKDRRPPLDVDKEDIDAIDANVANEA